MRNNMLNTINTFQYYISKAWDSVSKSTVCAIAAIFAYLQPILIIILCCLIFIALDFIFGYIVSRKYDKKKIESNKLWKSVHKVVEAVVGITCAYILDTTIITSIDLHAVEVVAGIICGTEFWSLLESFSELSPGGPWKILKTVIKKKGEKYLDIDLNNLDNTKNEYTQSDTNI